jgi:hypothetical protein
MRQFDIDGLDAEEQQDVLNTSNKFLGIATGVVLLFGLVSGFVVTERVLLEREIRYTQQQFMNQNPNSFNEAPS